MTDCYRCGSGDHLYRDCPAAPGTTPGTSPAAATRPDSPQNHLPGYNQGVPPRKQPLDCAAWAAEARTMLARALGHGGDEGTGDSPVVIPPFRERFGLPPRTENELRAIAAEQVAEARARAEQAG